MRIATWNPGKGLGERFSPMKRNFAESLGVDVLVLSEHGFGCPDLGVGALHLDNGPRQGGVALVVFKGTIRVDDTARVEFGSYLPVVWNHPVHGPINVLACYANGPPYVSPTLSALALWHRWLSERPSILAGDLNFNCRWDIVGKPGGFRSILTHLGMAGMRSAWHELRGEENGAESTMTYRHGRYGWHVPDDLVEMRHKSHVDYIFVGREFVMHSCQLIDTPSDHRALIVEATIPTVQ